MSSIVKPAGAYQVEESGAAPRTIKAVTDLKSFLVSFVDGEGKSQTRIALRVPNTETFFVLQEKIQGNFVATSGNNWFNKALAKKLDGEEKVESI